ncbi:hypothetical protein HanPI659440_Chr12g0468061 [Helianthus annuus]|nr:hypothetical protein HanPI659440_Chr12g0468061 [Helianthus annuus]
MASHAKTTSSSMPAITSSQSIPPLPPVPSGSQKNAENVAKKPTPVFSKPTTVVSSSPTNNDLYSLILQMGDYMQQQNRTNDRILRESDEIKKIEEVSGGSLSIGVEITEFQHSSHNRPALYSIRCPVPGWIIEYALWIIGNDSGSRVLLSAFRILSSASRTLLPASRILH